MINSIGTLNLATIERLSGHAGILAFSCRELLGHITVMFGSLHAGDVFYIENHIKEERTSFAAFRNFICQNSLNYDILAKIPHPISDITKIHWLENSLQRCPQFDIPIGTWKSLNTSVASRSYTNLVKYLSDQYSSLPPDTPSRGGKAFGATDDLGKNTQRQGKNVSATEAKAAKATAATKATTPNASSNSSKHRKLTPSQHPHSPPKNRSIATDGKKSQPPWPANCINGQPDPRPSPQQDPTLAPDDEFVRPPIVFTARCIGSLPTTAMYAGQCLTTRRRTPASTSRPSKKPGDCTNPTGNDNVQALRPCLH